MNRFQNTARSSGIYRRLLSIFLFCAVILFFLAGLSSVSENTSREEAEGLEDSVRKSAVHCYALEGYYPEDLHYLETNYGITYDHEKYVVYYESIGENMMPDIRVIPLNSKGGADL